MYVPRNLHKILQIREDEGGTLNVVLSIYECDWIDIFLEIDS